MLRRYVLLQIPGTLMLLILLAVLHYRLGLSLTAASIVLAAWVAKDAALYPFVRSAYDPSSLAPQDRMLNESVVAEAGLEPSGYVRCRGELWRAELVAGSQPVARGHRARVVAVRGLTLIVIAEPAVGRRLHAPPGGPSTPRGRRASSGGSLPQRRARLRK